MAGDLRPVLNPKNQGRANYFWGGKSVAKKTAANVQAIARCLKVINKQGTAKHLSVDVVPDVYGFI